MIQYFAKSHIGQRKVNEDSYYADEELGLYIVADGVGGLAKGEVASKLACQVITQNVKNGKSLSEAVLEAHEKIISSLEINEKQKGMASTVVAALFNENVYEIAWVGDSRAYIWDGELKLITRDHSYVELLLETGHITYEQMQSHPEKNVISQALGITRKKIRVGSNKGTLEKDQILMLSTDGLYEIAQEGQVIKQLKNMVNIQGLTTKLINYAVNSGGKDNITLLTLKSDFDSKNKEDIMEANVIRKFDGETGGVIMIKQKDNAETKEKDINELKVKSITPRAVSSIEKKTEEKVKFIEFLSLIALFIVLMLLMTYML